MLYNSKIIREDLEVIINSNIEWSRLKGKTILISGVNGFLSTYLSYTIFYLNERKGMNIKLVGLARNGEKVKTRFNSFLKSTLVDFLIQDVSNPITYNKPIDFIIHAASQASPNFYGIDPIGTLKANTIGTLNLLELAEKNKVESFLYFSSSEIYGQVDVDISENDYGIVNPMLVRSCYAESKRMGENMCVSWNHQLNTPAVIVRPFHTYGPGMDIDDGRVYADFVRNVVNNQNIKIRSDGTARRAFCYVSDATIAFFKVLLEGDPGDVYNVGNPKEEFSILELAESLSKMFSEKQIKVVKEGIKNNYIKSTVSRSLPNIDKLGKLNWEPMISVEQGFKRTINYYNE
jgi:UDP-glucuronate decarboxylase